MPMLLCNCGQEIEVPLTSAGLIIQCTACGGEISVPPLRVLRSSLECGERIPCVATPVADRSSHAVHGGLGAPYFVHCSGDVGFNARVSTLAMENFVGVVIGLVESFVDELPSDTKFEFMISCALFPQGNRLVLIETLPAAAAVDSVQNLRAAIEQTPAPPIVDGPVAFAIYCSVNAPEVNQIALQPFAPYQQEIAKLGADAALMKAAGCTTDNDTIRGRTRGLLQRLRRRVAGAFPALSDHPTRSAANSYQDRKAMLEESELRFERAPIEELEKLAVNDPTGLIALGALAARFAQKGEWTNAIGCYDAAINLDPEFAALYTRRAQAHLYAGNRQASLADWNRAIELDTSDAWSLFNRARLFADLGAWAQAEADLDLAHDLAPREPSVILTRARIRLMRGGVLEAIEDLRHVLQLDPHNGNAHLQLGEIYRLGANHDLNLAADHLTHAVRLMPGDPAPRIGRCLVYASQNKFEHAMQDCEAVIQMQPNSGGGHGLRGQILQMQCEFAEAIDACNRAIELGWETAQVLLTRAIAYAETDQVELALADCEAALVLAPDDPFALQLRGMLLMQRGELDTAMESLTKAKELAPEWSKPHEQLALLHRLTDDPQAAVDEQSILVAQQPGNPAHYINRAFAYTQLGDYQSAECDYDQACQLDPENEQVFYLRGCFFMDRQEPELALRDLDRVLAISDEHDDARYRRATILLHLNKHAEALREYGKLIARHPENPFAYSGHAFASQMIGDLDAADVDFDHLAQLAPEKSQALQIQALVGKVHSLESQDRYQEAIQVAQQIIDLADDEPTGYRMRAWIYWYTEQLVEAYDDYTRLLEMNPGDSAILNARGQVQAEMGDFNTALTDLNAAVDQSRQAGQHQLLAYALNGRAFALAGLGRMEESTRDYDESVRLCPANAWAYYNRAVVMRGCGEQAEAKELFERALASNDPPLPKRKRERAQSLLAELGADQT